MLSHCYGVDGKEVLEKGKKSQPLFLLNNSVDHENLKDFFLLSKLKLSQKTLVIYFGDVLKKCFLSKPMKL